MNNQAGRLSCLVVVSGGGFVRLENSLLQERGNAALALPLNHTMKVKNNSPLEPSARKKRMLFRLAYVFAVLLVAGALFLVYQKATHAEPGLYAIEASQDSHVPGYQNGVSLQHYFSGNSLQIRYSIKTLTDAYSKALKDVYRLLDNSEIYSDWVNLASINRNRGQELIVSPELYELLRLADALSRREGSCYNLYAGALYAEWEALRFLLEPAKADPVCDSDEAARLERLRAATADLSNFSLEFLDDEACKLRFTVDPAYLKLLEELELSDVPILDLNLLEDAFKLQLVAKRLEEQHFDCGYLCTDDGLALALSAFDQPGNFTLYGLGEDGVAVTALSPVSAGSAAVSLRNFPLEGEEGYYSVQLDGKSLLRSPWLPADGQYQNSLLSALVCSKKQSLVDSVYYSLQLVAAESAAALRDLTSSHGEFETSLLLQDGSKTIWSDAKGILVNEQAGFRLEPCSALR